VHALLPSPPPLSLSLSLWQCFFYMYDKLCTLYGKLVKTSMGCVGVSKETVVNVEISWYTVWLRRIYWCFFSTTRCTNWNANLFLHLQLCTLYLRSQSKDVKWLGIKLEISHTEGGTLVNQLCHPCSYVTRYSCFVYCLGVCLPVLWCSYCLESHRSETVPLNDLIQVYYRQMLKHMSNLQTFS